VELESHALGFFFQDEAEFGIFADGFIPFDPSELC
jgi:hypothetical protein